MDRLRYVLGLITLAVIVGGCWFLLSLVDKDDIDRQFQLEVAFRTARGLKPGADVKYRGIRVGTVWQVDVSKAGDQALVFVTLEEEKKHLVRDNSRFWVVTPRFHGLTRGMSGLETLVRSSYLAFSTPDPIGEPLVSGSKFLGDEQPLLLLEDTSLPAVKRGDLQMQLLLPENHGISVGARVLFRGMATGEVRQIRLAPMGTHVEVLLRIDSAYRSTVTDTSVFWVARPDLAGGIFSGFSVRELSALISPYVSYYTETKVGLPVSDGYRVAAHLERPEIEVSEVPSKALVNNPSQGTGKKIDALCLVHVLYEAVDVDWISSNDLIRREGTGVLYVDANGRGRVLTARSICDASYYYHETFGEKARIEKEKIVVVLQQGHALTASRHPWVDPRGRDLVVLSMQGLPHTAPTTKAEVLAFIDPIPQKEKHIRAMGEGGILQEPRRLQLTKEFLAECRGGPILLGEQVVGILGQKGEKSDEPVVVPLTVLPPSLRPER